MKSVYDDFLGADPIAVIGASDRRGNFGAAVYRTLRDKGFTAYPVNPNTATVDGDDCYPSVGDVPTDVTSAVIAVNPELALSMIEALSRAGVKRIWFQRGADFSSAATRAREAGIEAVEGRCILMFAQPVKGIHAFHRTLLRLFGRL